MRILLIGLDGLKAITTVSNDKVNVVYMTDSIGAIDRVFRHELNATENVEGQPQPIPVFVEGDNRLYGPAQPEKVSVKFDN